MKIIDEALLARLRRGGGCEWCRVWYPFRHPHHLWGRGMGGATRLDVRINLVSLCPECHHRTHRGHIQRTDYQESDTFTPCGGFPSTAGLTPWTAFGVEMKEAPELATPRPG